MGARSIRGLNTHDGHVVKSYELTTVPPGRPELRKYLELYKSYKIHDFFEID